MSPTRVIRTAFFVILALLPFIAYTQISAHPTSTTSAFRLPIGSGLNVYVYQGNNDTQYDHVGKAAWAFDFTVGATNFKVAAAQGGTVIGADDSSTTGCADVSCWTQANYVLITDDDGTTAALYLHLLHNSLKVKPGMHVNQGESIGLADTTGWATGPHLHFQVENIPSSAAQQQHNPGWWWTQSIPVSFSNPEVLAKDTNGVPQEGQSFPVSATTSTPTSSSTPLPIFKLEVSPSSIDASDSNICPHGKCEMTLSSPNSNTLNINWKATITIRAGAGTGIIGSVSPSSGTLAPGQVITVSFIISTFICGDITGSTITFTGGVSPLEVQLSGSFGPC